MADNPNDPPNQPDVSPDEPNDNPNQPHESANPPEPTVSTTPTGTSESKANKLVNIDTTEVNNVGVFTTAQSLVTFPGAVAAVTTIWNVLSKVSPTTLGKENVWVPIILSLVLGLFIFLLSVTKGATWKEKLSGFGIALINSFTIAAAALGIN
jgi:hypothetical protein